MQRFDGIGGDANAGSRSRRQSGIVKYKQIMMTVSDHGTTKKKATIGFQQY